MRDLGHNKRLRLDMDWEKYEEIANGERIEGTLPGDGVTLYTVGVFEGEGDDFKHGREFSEILQTFKFSGGGDVKVDQVPLVVKEAFDDWFKKRREKKSWPFR